MKIFSLKGDVLIDTSSAENSLHKVKEKTDKTNKSFTESIKTAGKWAAGLCAGAVAVGTAVYAATEKLASNLDTIDKASTRMGITAESYQKLSYAAGQCGLEMSTMEKAAKKLVGTDINFDDAIASIMELGTAEERTQKAQELFGDSIAYELSPMLSQSTEDFNGLIEKADALGLVMSGDVVSAGATLGDTMADIKSSLGAVGTELLVELMPYVQEACNLVMANMPQIKSAIKSAIEVIAPILKGVWKIVQPILSAASSAIELIVTLIGNVVDGLKNIKIPKIKLPHIAIKPKGWEIGDLLKGSIPKLSIDWYARAMSQPVALNGATLFGTMNGRLLGGGETGTEYITGADGIKNAMREVLASMNLQVVMDSGALVGSIAPKMDRELGNLYRRNQR